MENLTTEELAARWRRDPLWITRQARSGRIPGAWKLGHQWRFNTQEIETYEKANRQTTIYDLTPGARARQRKTA